MGGRERKCCHCTNLNGYASMQWLPLYRCFTYCRITNWINMCLMLCAPLDWQYAELPSSASDAVLCSVLVRKMWDIQPNRKKKKINTHWDSKYDRKGIYYFPRKNGTIHFWDSCLLFTHCNHVTQKTLNLKSKYESLKSRKKYLIFLTLCFLGLYACLII